MTEDANNQAAYAAAMVRHGSYTNSVRLMRHLQYVCGSVDGVRSALDIGGGVGSLSFYLASQGAKRVVCIEPEADGSTEGVTSVFDKLREDIPLSENVELARTTFQGYDPGTEKFDLIVAHNSINHLNEPACEDLKSNSQSYETYIGYFERIFDMLESGGRFVALDCSRYNFFDAIGISNPVMPDIEWDKHQSPYMWREMLERVGFVDSAIQWTSFNALGAVGRLLMNNPVVGYILLSHFRLSVRKP